MVKKQISIWTFKHITIFQFYYLILCIINSDLHALGDVGVLKVYNHLHVYMTVCAFVYVYV